MNPTTPFASNIYRRFIPDGRVLARRPVKIGREYQPGEEIPNAEIPSRALWQLWEQAMVDTLPVAEPTDAELERLTAPQAKQPIKQTAARR